MIRKFLLKLLAGNQPVMINTHINLGKVLGEITLGGNMLMINSRITIKTEDKIEDVQ